jgi:hypothetical protein
MSEIKMKDKYFGSSPPSSANFVDGGKITSQKGG